MIHYCDYLLDKLCLGGREIRRGSFLGFFVTFEIFATSTNGGVRDWIY